MQSRYIHGDSLLEIPKLPDNYFQLILTDPPYEISRPNNFASIGRAGIEFGDWDHNFNQTSWIELAYSKLKKNGSLVIFNDWKKLGSIAEYCETLGFSIKRVLTWVKTNPNPANPKRLFLQGTEHALWAVKGDGWVYNQTYHRGYFSYAVPQEYKKDADGNKLPRHPTKKPDGLFKELISTLSNPSDYVLDPFCGSGTTGKCAAALGRNYICIEKEQNYYDMCIHI